MAFYRGLRYGKLKKALVLKMSLSKDQLTTQPLWERIQRDRGQPFKRRQYDSQTAKGIDYKNLLPKPVRMKSAPGRRDKNFYCKYHREHGHDTNECRILKSEIEKHLKELVDRGDQWDIPRQNRRSLQKDNRP
ncbi:hypothetical protein LIER_25120 [Lithospermum erythrorhizon]|uniref:Uncharacterized protein n=1 Tax=Lithospermum erythrorhizon TaxID=34254 RepID=A0AAV3R3L2_LITER